MNFNPRSPRGERPAMENMIGYAICISIHAPREGSDKKRGEPGGTAEDFNPRSPRGERHGGAAGLRQAGRFQSTLPARGATVLYGADGETVQFQSTLPARGATGRGQGCLGAGKDFNPRSPRGERRTWHTARPFPLTFQSTLPARGATGTG